MKKKLPTILLGVMLLAGLCLLLYPTVSDYWNSFHQSRAIANYAEDVSKLDAAVYQQMLADAGEYNASLLEKGNPFFCTEEETAVYNTLLNLSENGMMGYVEIPAINCSLPVYHGTDEAVLQIAIGHIEGSSLPIGGESTHAVLSGHRGLPSAKLLTDLDKIKEGDVFVLQILNEVLTYEVDQIRIVLPDEMDDLYIQKGRDYCTLVTCTPYGLNTHRLLVRGHRIENLAGTARVTAEAMKIDPIIVAPFAAAPMLIILFIWMFTSTGKKNRKKKTEKGRAKS